MRLLRVCAQITFAFVRTPSKVDCYLLARFIAHAGSAAFAFHDARTLEAGVTLPQPRAALHDALLHPSRALNAPHLIDE